MNIDIRQIETSSLFDLSRSIAGGAVGAHIYPWEFLGEIGGFIKSWRPEEGYEPAGEYVWIHKTAKIAPTAHISGPCIIGPDTEVRHCAFIRGNAVVGAGCVVGNSVELKNCVLFDGVQVPHYNYVGDSILGYKAHMGAGSITSNVKSDKSEVVIKGGGIAVAANRKKVGAMLGDFVEIGCNSVLNPGTVIGRASSVYPLSSVRGIVPAESIYKSKDDIVKKH